MPPWPMAMPSSTAIVLNSRPTPPASATASATRPPRSLQVHVAGHELGEAVGDGDDRLAEVVVGHAGGAPEGAGAGHVATVGRGPRPQLRHAYQHDTVGAPAHPGICRVPTDAHPAPHDVRPSGTLGGVHFPPGMVAVAALSGLVAAVAAVLLTVVARRRTRPRRPAHVLLAVAAGVAPAQPPGRGGRRAQRDDHWAPRAGSAHRLGDRGRDRHGGERAGLRALVCSGCPGSPPPRRERPGSPWTAWSWRRRCGSSAGCSSPSRPGCSVPPPRWPARRSCWPR